MDIQLLKLYNSDWLIGEVSLLNDGASIEVKNPRMVIMMPSPSGVSIAMKPVCFPFACSRLKDTLIVQKSQVMFSLSDVGNEIDKEIVNGYKSEVAGIKIASAADTAKVIGKSNGEIII